MKNIDDLVIFCGQGNTELGFKILKALGELSGQPRNKFDHIDFSTHYDNEINNQLKKYEKIKDAVVIVYQSMYEQKYYNEALDIIWACKHQYKARYVIGVFPFLINRRQDPVMPDDKKEEWENKKPKPHEVQRLKETIYFLKCAGLDEMLVVTPHSKKMSEYCKHYGIKFNELEPSRIFEEKTKAFILPENRNLVRVYAPDEGSIPRAVKFARLFPCPVLFNFKTRGEDNEISILNKNPDEVQNKLIEFRKKYKFKKIDYFSNDSIKDKIIIIIDDEASSCSTVNTVARNLIKNGADCIYSCTTHPVLVYNWRDKLFLNNPFKKIIMTNTIPRGLQKSSDGGIVDVSVHEMISDCLYQIVSRL